MSTEMHSQVRTKANSPSSAPNCVMADFFESVLATPRKPKSHGVGNPIDLPTIGLPLDYQGHRTTSQPSLSRAGARVA